MKCSCLVKIEILSRVMEGSIYVLSACLQIEALHFSRVSQLEATDVLITSSMMTGTYLCNACCEKGRIS